MIAVGAGRFRAVPHGPGGSFSPEDPRHKIRRRPDGTVFNGSHFLRADGGNGIARARLSRYLHGSRRFQNLLLVQNHTGRLQIPVDLCPDLFRILAVRKHVSDRLEQSAARFIARESRPGRPDIQRNLELQSSGDGILPQFLPGHFIVQDIKVFSPLRGFQHVNAVNPAGEGYRVPVGCLQPDCRNPNLSVGVRHAEGNLRRQGQEVWFLAESAHHAGNGGPHAADDPRALMPVHGIGSQNAALPSLHPILQNPVQELRLRLLGQIRPFRKLHGFFQKHLHHVVVECTLFIPLKGIGAGRRQPQSVLKEVPVRARSKSLRPGNGHAVGNVKLPGLLRRDRSGRRRHVQPLQDAFDLLFPFVALIQRAEGIPPERVLL